MTGSEGAVTFRDRFLDGQGLYGTFLKTPTTHATEILGIAGYDFVVVDQEHGPFGRESTDAVLLACRAYGVGGVVRVPDSAPSSILAALDCGAAGLLVPHVDSPEKARSVVASCRYRGGVRGFSNTTRAGGFGEASIPDHIARQDREVCVIAMIEDPPALEMIDASSVVVSIDRFLRSVMLGHVSVFTKKGFVVFARNGARLKTTVLISRPNFRASPMIAKIWMCSALRRYFSSVRARRRHSAA